MIKRCAIGFFLCLVWISVSPAQANDPYPLSTLAFFNLDACPENWSTAKATIDGQPQQEIDGYTLLPFYDPSSINIGTAVGTALENGEDRSHTHDFSSSISLESKQYSGVAGCCNKNLTSSGTHDFTGTTEEASSDIPYVQLLLCEKTTYTQTTNPPTNLPNTVVTFFNTKDCPSGWKKTQTTSGRFLVGLPDGGTPGTSFGGDSLTEASLPDHSHDFSGTVSISKYKVTLATGCCAGGYGDHGTKSYSGTTESGSVGLPFLPVTQCQPCVTDDDDPSCQ